MKIYFFGNNSLNIPSAINSFGSNTMSTWWWLFVLVLQFQKILNFYIQRTRVLYPTCQQAAWGWAWSSLKYPSSSITYVQQAAWGADRGRVSGEKRRLPGATSINNHIIDMESYSRSQREYIQIFWCYFRQQSHLGPGILLTITKQREYIQINFFSEFCRFHGNRDPRAYHKRQTNNGCCWWR